MSVLPNQELPNHERLLDLLALRATQGLSDVETAELERLLGEHPEVSGDEFEASVAALLLARVATPERLPEDLAKRILSSVSLGAAPSGIPASSTSTSGSASLNVIAARSFWRSPAAGWWSAAACLLLAIAGWWPRFAGEQAESVPPAVVLTPAQQRAVLLDSGRAIQAAWSPGNDAPGNTLVGDVVFDPVTQHGYLRFRGIPANDPRLEQYQLWIADAARTPPEPVDGGVFNTPQATATGDVIIPFEAKLPVGKPAAFVVTVEKPGGVVVSKQERVVALAKVTAR